MLSDDYESIRQTFLNETTKPMGRTDFILSMQKYMKILQDGHMGTNLHNAGYFINVDWTATDRKLYLNDDTGRVSKNEVIEIGGVQVNDIFNIIDIYHFYENSADRDSLHAALAKDVRMLELAGVPLESSPGQNFLDYRPVAVNIYDNENGILNKREFSINTSNLWSALGRVPMNIPMRHRMIDDVFYIEFNGCVQHPSVDETISAVEDAIKNGTKKFIVDIRNNGGGDSFVGERLLNAMGINVPHYGFVLRVSEMAVTQSKITIDENLPMIDVYSYAPDISNAANPNEVFISVLTGPNTYSAAIMFGVWVQDGRFGNIIGWPGRNAPNCFGDMMTLTLRSLRLDIHISSKRFYRPDVNADPNYLRPDILVHPNDALDAALDFFNNT
jgi:hypothetical protein